MLVPASARGAVVSFNGRVFGFAAKESALQFAANPDAFLKARPHTSFMPR
jgi:hypothetical protein